MQRAIQTTLIITLALLAGVCLPAALTAFQAGQGSGTVVAADEGSEPTAEEAARPSIMIPDPLYTFEPVVDGTEVVHDFRVYNRGTGPLAIQKVQTG